MRHFILLAALVAFGITCETASAGYPYGYGNGYGNNYNYAPNYGYQVNNNYGGPTYAQPYGYGYYEPFPAAAWRIRAEHSRARYFTHPLSLQNGPPVPEGYGWGY